MIGLDSNVLVRYLAQDDAAQSARATRLLERELDQRNPGYVGLVVLVETCWVLKRIYGADGTELRDAIADLLDARLLVVEQRALVARALARLGPARGDIAAALIAEGAVAAGCSRTFTFDKSATKLGMVLLK